MQTLTELSKKFHAGEITSREITENFIKNIEKNDGKINAFITTTFDLAREQADAADARQKNKTLRSPLDGMPISLKDVISTRGIRTTAASKILKNYSPPLDATVWQKLKSAGAVLLGKTNTDEFTMGGSTENSAFGITKNPHDLQKVPGGSSGGAAASIAADFCAGAIGTDTGGSIRQPANFCGCTGLKVSYGRVSRWGTIPMASSFDTIGPLARTASDCALLLQTIAGSDPRDSTTPRIEVPDYSREIEKNIDGLRIGIPTEYFLDGIDPEILEMIESAKEICRTLGAKIVEISLPHTKYAIPSYYLAITSEISANMSRFDGIRFGETAPDAKNLEEIYTQTRESNLGDEVKRRILLGTYALSAGYYDAFYRKSQKVRTLIRADFDDAFQKIDAILAPVSPTPAFDIGKNTADPLQMYLEDIFTVPASLAGICGISVPIGKTEKNLPLGVQFLCPAFEESRALRIAHQIQQEMK